ncbi:cell division protein SepF [Thermogymnomonas acidicola]|uniref:cell division protein SepF n=1 Tax=Thermogymnomonas acidicola TaxID=399579 RepID=UPI00094639DB|nr:cell division protein SepF [Thermogymnomonas acidicola]
MPLFRRRGGQEESQREPRRFIDLNDVKVEDEEERPVSYVRVAEVRRTDDLGRVRDLVHSGNIVIVDCTLVSSDEVVLKRIMDEMRIISRDANGDVAGLSKSLFVLTPPRDKDRQEQDQEPGLTPVPPGCPPLWRSLCSS